MAPPTSSAAIARADAIRLRAHASELTLAARRHQRDARQATAAAATVYECSRAIRRAGLPSPWSSLTWLPPDRELEQILLVVE
jgi:hypothetical protein